jgi:hypothetical protein
MASIFADLADTRILCGFLPIFANLRYTEFMQILHGFFWVMYSFLIHVSLRQKNRVTQMIYN